MSGCAPRRARFREERFGVCERLSRSPFVLALSLLGSLPFANPAFAQSGSVINTPLVGPNSFTTLVSPVLSPDFNRDHNVAVLEEWHPDYQAPGAQIGSFVLHPQMTVGTLFDSNVYATQSNKDRDVALVLQPSASLMSDWSRHSLQLQASSDVRRYATQLRRNLNSWDVLATGRADLGSHLVLQVEGRSGRYFESPYGNDLSPDAQVLSNFSRSSGLLKVIYTGGQIRLSAAYDHSSYDFATLHFPNGLVVEQVYRNRIIDRFSGQSEVALSPSVALYLAGSFDRTDYSKAQNINTPVRTSSGQSVLGGVSFDLAGVMRGIIGVGYSNRNYAASAYPVVGAFSAQARVDLFPYQTTTVSFIAQRLVQDSGLNSLAYVDTRVSAEVDQSLRENIILIVSAAVARQQYLGVDGMRLSRQLQSTLRYQATRWLGFQAEVSYRYSEPSTASQGTTYEGLLFGLSVTARR